MIGITHKLRGFHALRNQLSALPGVARAAAAQTLDQVAESAAADLQRTLASGPRRHSAPGAPPADPKGRLAAAVRSDRAPDGTATSVTIDLPFARDLEFGTAKIAARPFLRPAMLRHTGAAKAALGAAMRGACSALGKGSL